MTEQTKIELSDSERQPCEVWTRVMAISAPFPNSISARNPNMRNVSAFPKRKPQASVWISRQSKLIMSISIGGVESFTTVDFPHRLAAVLFCRGCPLRCPYCHNPELQMFAGKDYISWETFIEFLKTRQKLLDGVVFSGGEPLAQAELRSAMEQVKSMGFEVGLHTSGVNPQRLAEVLPLITWVGFDVKTDFDNYGRIPLANGKTAEKCLDLCLESGVELNVARRLTRA